MDGCGTRLWSSEAKGTRYRADCYMRESLQRPRLAFVPELLRVESGEASKEGCDAQGLKSGNENFPSPHHVTVSQTQNMKHELHDPEMFPKKKRARPAGAEKRLVAVNGAGPTCRQAR